MTAVNCEWRNGVFRNDHKVVLFKMIRTVSLKKRYSELYAWVLKCILMGLWVEDGLQMLESTFFVIFATETNFKRQRNLVDSGQSSPYPHFVLCSSKPPIL